MQQFSPVEKHFFNQQSIKTQTSSIPYIVLDNFPQLGLITSLRFLEWSSNNPNGVISLPTGKTPEYFIKWTHHILQNWDNKAVQKLREDNGLLIKDKPSLRGLKFVQIDEFYPLNPNQHNSFYNYVCKYYIEGFELDPQKALLINSDKIPLVNGKNRKQIFPDHKIDLTLRFRDATSEIEEEQQESILLIDQWCAEYENKIRSMGGIGFFLGGIGPDGHIAFNVRGSDHNSTTRLTGTNFETQAAAATDLGGIEISRNRLVITIGLGTITYNPDATGIIIAAGEAKSKIIKNSLEHAPDVKYPATALSKLKKSCFYITKGAGKLLTDFERDYWENSEWNDQKLQRSILELSRDINVFGKKLSLDNLQNDEHCKNIPSLNADTVSDVIKKVESKVEKGSKLETNQIFYHTGPHHDDIMLGLMPYVIQLIREPSNHHHFVNMTSGFTSVTNDFIQTLLQDTKSFLAGDKIQMTRYDDFFESGYKKKWDKDVFHYLDAIADNNSSQQKRGMSHRLVRALIETYGVKNASELSNTIEEAVVEIQGYYDGEKNSKEVQSLKGMIREYEEELVWANYGVRVQDVHHLRLGFYQGDIFTENPQINRDVLPVLEQLRTIKPTVISVAFDPEGSGPDTHYKVLQTIAEAVRIWNKTEDLSELRIWGYRNVWYRFDVDEADIIVPVTLNSMAIMRSTFNNCYLSQKEASFPSYEFDGPFCDLSQNIWVKQHKDLQLLLGRDYWYQNKNPHLRAVHGVVNLKEMNVNQFLSVARKLEQQMEGSPV
ncbi:glucosamine-6-phosphate isomerase [Candidatus Marinimicrobia bacterium]|nr:glucosamine-6-phosphate isomerase [Candidatus Neomarinimicrobiota bacterium]